MYCRRTAASACSSGWSSPSWSRRVCATSATPPSASRSYGNLIATMLQLWQLKLWQIAINLVFTGLSVSASEAAAGRLTPNLPTSIIRTNIAWLKFSGNPLRAWEFHPFKSRLCWSQTLWNPMLVGRLGVSQRSFLVKMGENKRTKKKSKSNSLRNQKN